jgi:hypothetical protein
MVHINTDLRVLYRDGLASSLTAGGEVAPYKFITPAVVSMQEYVAQKLKLFALQ